MAESQVLISLFDHTLSLFVSDDWLSNPRCATLHIELECPAAVQFETSTRYQPVRAWACNKAPADGQTRCSQHWCSHFWVYALDGQPVGMAASTQQLAALLHLSKVQICGTASKQPVQLPAAFAATANHQQQQQAKKQQENPRQDGTSTKQDQQHQQQQQQQQQEELKPELKLTIPKQSSTPVRKPCCTVMVMLEVGGPEDFVLGPAYKVPYSWCCGREAGSKDFCKQHYTSRFVVLDRNLGVLATFNALHLLAANLGYAAINLSTEQPDLLQKLLSQSCPTAAAGRPGSASGDAAAAAAPGGVADAAAAMAVDSPPVSAAAAQQEQLQQQQLGVGQKRNSVEAELPHPANPAKVATNGRTGAGSSAAAAAAAAAGGGGKVSDAPAAIMRLQLTGEDASEQRQVLHRLKEGLQDKQRQQQQQQQQGKQQEELQQELQELEGQMDRLGLLCGAGLDVMLPVAQGSSSNPRTRCLGVNLQLAVTDLKQLDNTSTFVRILNGHQCGHEGGVKRACKKHRLCTFTLLSLTGQHIMSASHLAALAQRLKVSTAALLDGSDLSPLPDYAALPATPTWRKAADSSKLTVWLPPDSKALPGNWQQKPCCGLDVYVDRPQTMDQAIGSAVSVMAIVRCGNESGVRATCKRHTAQGPLQLFSWSDSLAGAASLNTAPGGPVIHVCADLAQLAMWLGVGKVEVLDAASKEPLPFFKNLSIPPAVQLALTEVQQALTHASLAPPSLPGMGTAAGVGAGSAAAAAAAAGVAAVRLEGGADGAADGPDAAAAAAGGVVGSLTAVAQAGGLAAVNLFGNSRVDISAQDGIQQQQAEGSDQQQQQQQQQRQVSVVVEPRPVGGHQGHPCRMLHLVLLLQDKTAFERGQQYPVLFAHRCGNEAGNRSRCRQHADAAVRVLATDPASVHTSVTTQNLPAYALHSAKPALTNGVALAVVQESQLLGKVNSSRETAALLGVGSFRLLDGLTGEELGDVTGWSPTNAAGTAAKVAQSNRDATATAAMLAAVAAAGVPGVPNAQALLAALQGQIGGMSAAAVTRVEALELDATLPATAGMAAAPAPPAAAAGDADVVMGDAAAEDAVQGAAAAAPQPQQQQQQQQSMPQGLMAAAQSAAAGQQPAAVPAAGSGSAGAAASGGSSSGFGSSAPRHLQQWAVNFKPGSGQP